DDTRRWLVNKNVHENNDGHYALMLNGKRVGAYLNVGGGDEKRIEAWSLELLHVDRWQHLAFTYDTQVVKVYLDGKEVAINSVVVPRPRVPGKTPLTIGARQDGYDKSFFHGRLDDIRIYGRALSPEEIRAHWLNFDAPVETGAKAPAFRSRF